MNSILPVGKLPSHLLARLLSAAPTHDPRLRLGPGIGFDCAVIDFPDRYLVLKSDPITFATDAIGWYLVQVNSNDLATTGATPRWLMVTTLLPENKTTFEQTENIFQQVYQACDELGISVAGGHTEVTYGLERAILVGTLLGEVSHDRLVVPQGARPGDHILLTKGVPIEATALLAREMEERLQPFLSQAELEQAAHFLYDPGISVLRDSRLALENGKVHAMHDPTEGGLAGALWELADAADLQLVFNPASVLVPEVSRKVCTILEIDPLAAIASGALLLLVPESDAQNICQALIHGGIACADIGQTEAGPPTVWQVTPAGRQVLPRPARDEIARLFGG